MKCWRMSIYQRFTLDNQDIQMTQMLRTLVASAVRPRAVEYILFTAGVGVAMIVVLYQL
jgi:hypothetical protein